MTRFYYWLFILSTAADGYHIWSGPDDLPDTIPKSCRSALSQNLTCSSGLIKADSLGAGRFPDVLTLSDYCQPDCLSSLQEFKQNVDSSCGDTTYQMYTNGRSQSGASIANPLLWAYHTSCLQDGEDFCLPAIRHGSVGACSKCALSYGAAMLDNEYGRQRVQPAPFSSLLSSCGIPTSSYTYTYTPTSSTSSSTASMGACKGDTYTAREGETCQSIAESNSIATDRLIAANALDYNCTTLSPGLELCLESPCALHTVDEAETCSDITKGKGFSVLQLTSWNPTIHTNCDNLDSMAGRSICVSPPGSSKYEESSMRLNATSTITRMFTGPYTPGSLITNPPSTSTPWFNSQTNFSAPSSTETIDYNATSVSLVLSIASLCPVQPSDVEMGWTLADLPDSCEDMIEPYCYPDLSKPAPTSRDFPAKCSPGYYATTATHASSSTVSATNSVSPTQSGIASSCTNYYKAVSGDTCQGISDAYGLSVDAFEDMNPAVGSECKSLWLGYYYCVASSSSSTSTAQTTTASSSPTSRAPQPQQAGIVDDCNKYYKVSSGDYCAAIAKSHDISTEDFLGWNTGIDPDCGNLFVNNYVCVGVGASPCVVDVSFHTSHSTEWGEAVIVVGSVPALGNWDVNGALSMTGSSGGANGVTNWDVTGELPANTRVAYKFVKVQTDGTAVWESDPNRHVQTTDCGGGAVERQGGNWHDGSITSCNTVPVSFQVMAQTSYGEAVYIIGSAPPLGQWSTDAAVALSADQYTDSNPLWQGSVRLAIGMDVQYKFIKIGLDGSFTWESDPNRQFTVPTDCYATPLQSETFK